MRSDLVLKGNDFLRFFVQYNLLPFYDEYRILKQRVVMTTTCNPKRRYKFPFNASDWFYFGLTEDVIKIFDIPLLRNKIFKKGESGEDSFVESPYSAEQYIWFGFISKYVQIPFKHYMDISGENIELSEKYFANNTILLTARQAKIDWLKYPGAAYAQIPCLSNSGLYTFTDYKKMLNKYSNCNLLIIPNIFEELIYFIVYNLRFFIKNKNPKLHDFICKLVNRDNHLRVEKNIQKLKNKSS